MTNLDCRFYEAEFPEAGDLVMVVIKHVTDMGVYVHLLEYNNVEGMVLFSELTSRRIRSIPKVARLERKEVCAVLRVDKKGYIDLSKKRANPPEEVSQCEIRYNKAKIVHGIMRHVAQVTNSDLLELNQEITWKLYKIFGHAYDAFKLAIVDPEKVFKGIKMEDRVREILMQNIKRKLTPRPLKIRAEIEIKCYTYEGIDAIKEALRKGEELGKERGVPIEITLVAPPHFVMTTTTAYKDVGINILNEAIDSIHELIESKGGEFSVKIPPRSISETDEQDLADLMGKLEEENKDIGDDEISGDD
ncbi:eukaryotic translation initiation factor 2 subunit 1 [Anaeramoeba ignava]|uniref:Eukaryotic translation initiation factor 2 subunit 1 n=1 Tax=Anaeramoeba ignava TaxID=1746090 RepID=A0A9Q0RC98_ANAIG|nr:eukaryotic translation initiation factor 2 subunit 1 [Anaeramoeba ignava]KAJ5074919.1 eukaryotic translation initiation factor 2 subunit 1 [Anaeramoeba ignava]|eukprot:Anaeramoba_ignava/a358707_108.p1 GENE.a358707_108~~a358707_108.p1  ORF type:complete len:311 (-),score=98.78 a358707_108:63-974(-)